MGSQVYMENSNQSGQPSFWTDIMQKQMPLRVYYIGSLLQGLVCQSESELQPTECFQDREKFRF